MPEQLLPIDTNVVVPPSVKRAAKAAEDIHKQAYTPEPPKDPKDPTDPPVQSDPPRTPLVPHTPDPPVVDAKDPKDPPAQPDPPQPGSDDNLTAEQWKHRYLSMKGRHDQQLVNVGQLQQLLSDVGDELSRKTATPRTDPPPPQPNIRRLTEEDVRTYGPELVDLIQRAALDAVEPELKTVQQTTQRVSQRVAQSSTQSLYEHLDREVPTWREVNVDPRFKAWCRLPDVYSGQLRGKLLNAAFQAAQAPRVTAFFKGFLAEEVATGNAPDPQLQPQSQTAPRQAAVKLETLTAPGRAKPAPGNTEVPADKPVFTRAQISAFYSQRGRMAYVGRDEDRQRDEQAIFAAQKDGRVRG